MENNVKRSGRYPLEKEDILQYSKDQILEYLTNAMMHIVSLKREHQHHDDYLKGAISFSQVVIEQLSERG